MVVDQAAAVILCSNEIASRLGVPDARRVYLHGASEFLDTPKLSYRHDYCSMEALGRAGRRALELAEIGIDDLRHLDVYSCFPSAVQIAARELGIDPEAGLPLTLTGGLNFGGGPFNSYVLHATASAMDALRADPDSFGMVTSIGGWISKIAFQVLSTRPPLETFAFQNLDQQAGSLARRELAHDVEADAEIESFALACFQGRPHDMTVACLLDDGRRAWAVSDDPVHLALFSEEECCGRPVSLLPERRFRFR